MSGVSEVFNLLEGELVEAEERPGYRHRRTQVGRRLGAELLGATVYETPPGETLWPYHWELGCEEFLVVVAGTPTLRTPEGEAGAHQLRNDSAEPFRVLIGSTKSGLSVAGYPDSGKLLIDAPAHGKRLMLRDAPELDYWD